VKTDLTKRNEKICGLRMTGLTARQIGLQMKLTRSTVCGVLHRAGLGTQTIGRPRNDPNAPAKPARRKIMAGAIVEGLKDVRALELEPIPLGTDSGCQWVHGDPRDHVMCGHTTRGFSHWCPHHYSRVYQEIS
jgi:hypothetical protein